MSADFYAQPNQRLYIIPESAYLTPYQGAGAVTAIPANYGFVSACNIIPDGLDYELPILLKEKLYGIGSGGHPSLIVNTVNEPVDITINSFAQNMRFFALAIGYSTTTHVATKKEITSITCGTYASITAGDYFLIYGITPTTLVVKAYAVWFSKDGAGVGPTITGVTNLEVALLPADDTAIEVATKLAAALDGTAEFVAPNPGTAIVVCTDAEDGAVPDAIDSGDKPTAFIISTTTQGVSLHILIEYESRNIDSFTLHIEQRNDDTGEDILLDLFGCVIDSYTLSIDWDAKIIKETVKIKCPMYAEGVRLVNVPHEIKLATHTWGDLKESAANWLLMDGTDDKTPEIVSKAELIVENSVELFPDIGVKYCSYALTGKREVSLNIVGMAKTKDTFDYWKDSWDSVNDKYTNATGNLNTVLKLERTALYDYIIICVCNWLLPKHNCVLVSIDDRVRGVDLTLEDAPPIGGAGKKIFYPDTLIVDDLSSIEMLG